MIPANVTLDRGDQQPLDLTPLLDPNSLTWSSVVPGGFGSCSFQITCDFRSLVKQLPYLSIVRVVADSGRVLFEGQIEDLAPTLSDSTVGIKVGAFGLQNALKEQTVRTIWSKRDLNWTTTFLAPGSTIDGTRSVANPAVLTTNMGQFDPTNLAKSGVQVIAAGGNTLANNIAGVAEWLFPSGLTIVKWLGKFDTNGPDVGTNKYEAFWWALESNTWTLKSSSTTGGTGNAFSVAPTNPTAIAVGAGNASGAGYVPAVNDWIGFYDMRVLGVLSTEDVTDGFFGGTLINSLLTQVPALGAGIIESGGDFTIDHLDASVRRTAYDLLNEVAAYYSREWAVWENALLDWKTPNLSQHQWQVPLNVLTALDLDASIQNSQKTAFVLYTDAASGVTGESSATSIDRRNPYVLKGRVKDELDTQQLTMTSSTAAQLASVLLQDIGFGPVPAAGTIKLPGETIIDHASGASRKAWEIRAGDNVTLPELPLADIFTQDGRGEVLFHVVSTEADAGTGQVTLSLDSYGSKRSDVLLARLAAVTSALGG